MDCCASGYCCVTPANTVIPDTGNINLPGQMNIPGGGASNGTISVADGSGVNAVYQDPSVNPNPTGGWMPLAQDLINAAQRSYVQFEKGSIAAATPKAIAAKQIQQGQPGLTIGNTPIVFSNLNWATIAIVGVGIVVLIAVAKG